MFGHIVTFIMFSIQELSVLVAVFRPLALEPEASLSAVLGLHERAVASGLGSATGSMRASLRPSGPRVRVLAKRDPRALPNAPLVGEVAER